VSSCSATALWVGIGWTGLDADTNGGGHSLRHRLREFDINVYLTGGTGFIGSAVLGALINDGHQVAALVRSDSSAAKVASVGATAVIGDITDVGWLTDQLAGADAAIHTASPGDATSHDVDAAVAQAAAAAFTGTGKTYIHTGGVWVYGTGNDITEETPFDAPPITAWRAGVEALVLGIEGARAIVIAPGVVYGRGQGIANAIVHAPRSADGALNLIGDGSQHWATVQVDDLAELYLTALTNPSAVGYYIGVGSDNPTVRELGEAAVQALGGDAVRAESFEESAARLSAPFAEALLLDQQASGAKARSLGWQPRRPTLVEELRNGYGS
jgi:nucleoside-diphosphate-sugar epimerase